MRRSWIEQNPAFKSMQPDPPELPDFIRVSSPGESSVQITCRRCGSVVPDSGTIQMAHLDWHQELDEVASALRGLLQGLDG